MLEPEGQKKTCRRPYENVGDYDNYYYNYEKLVGDYHTWGIYNYAGNMHETIGIMGLPLTWKFPVIRSMYCIPYSCMHKMVECYIYYCFNTCM